MDAQPGIFVRELDAIANAKIDVNVWGVGDGLIAIEKRHIGEIDFPIKRARGTRIIGVVGRAPLGECGGSRKKEEEGKEDEAAQREAQVLQVQTLK